MPDQSHAIHCFDCDSMFTDKGSAATHAGGGHSVSDGGSYGGGATQG